MQRYSKIIILIFAFMVTLTVSHRGGGRPKIPSSFSRPGDVNRGNHNGLGPHTSYGGSQNCQTVNGVTTCTYNNNEKSYGSIFTIFLAVLAFVACNLKKSAYIIKRRQLIINEAMNQFSTKYLEQSTKVSFKEKKKLIKQLMNKKYSTVENSKDNKQKFQGKTEVMQLKPQNQKDQSKYIIKMTGHDNLGTSKIQGVVMFRPGGLRLKLFKIYDSKSKAEQAGQFDIISYEGEGRPQNIAGKWTLQTFRRHQNSEIQSGNWTMSQIDTQT